MRTDDNLHWSPQSSPQPWWANRSAGQAPFAEVSARNARRDARERARARAHGPEPDAELAQPSELPPAAPPPDNGMAIVFGVIGALSLLLVLVLAQAKAAPEAARFLLPIFGLCAAAAAGPWIARRHPDETWLPKYLVWAMVFKLIATYTRYQVFQGKGDAGVYDKFGREYANGTAQPLKDLHKTNFLKWFTGVVYVHFGIDIIVGFFVFGLIAFLGAYLWYRAATVAVPFLDKRIYFLLVFFAPSVAFWPAAIGKEAVMLFALGLVALGIAHLLTGSFLRGVIVAIPGGYLLWLVRPHLLAFMTLAAGVAYIIGRAPRRGNEGPSVFRPLGMILVAFLAVFAATQMASLLGMHGLSLKSINQELADVNGQTAQEGSKFNVGNSNLTPLSVPKGIVTVLLRPFPYQAHDKNQLLASAECLALIAFAIYRRKSVKLSLTRSRDTPFLFFCWTFFIVYATAFSAVANMGLLTRQRSLVLPAIYVLVSLSPALAEKRPRELSSTE